MAPEGASGSRRERNNGVEVLHCRSIEMLGSLVALCDYRPTRKQYKRSRAATCTGDYGTEVAAHAPEDRLKGKSLGFSVK